MGVKELPPVMTAEQYAKVTGYHVQTVREHCRLGIIPGAFKNRGSNKWLIRTAEALGVAS